MKRVQAIISEIYPSAQDDGHGALLSFASPIRITPGQYLQLWREADQPHLAETAFPTDLPGKNTLALDHIPVHWLPADEVQVYGALGNGFTLPPAAHNVVLASLDGGVERLLPLANLALAQGAAVVVSMPAIPADNLSPAIEVQPINALPDLLNWADYLALDIQANQLPELHALFAGRLHSNPISRSLLATCQVLVRTAMPCAGKSDCAICGIQTSHRKLSLVCKDGPVYSLKDLIDVAG